MFLVSPIGLHQTIKFGVPLKISEGFIVLGVFITILGAIGLYGVFSELGMYLRKLSIALIIINSLLKIVALLYVWVIWDTIKDVLYKPYDTCISLNDYNILKGIYKTPNSCYDPSADLAKIKSLHSGLYLPLLISGFLELIIGLIIHLSCLISNCLKRDVEISDENNETIQKTKTEISDETIQNIYLNLP